MDRPPETQAPSPIPRPHLVTCVRVLKSRERMDRSTSMQPMYWGREDGQSAGRAQPGDPSDNTTFSLGIQGSSPSLTATAAVPGPLRSMFWMSPLPTNIEPHPGPIPRLSCSVQDVTLDGGMHVQRVQSPPTWLADEPDRDHLAGKDANSSHLPSIETS